MSSRAETSSSGEIRHLVGLIDAGNQAGRINHISKVSDWSAFGDLGTGHGLSILAAQALVETADRIAADRGQPPRKMSATRKTISDAKTRVGELSKTLFPLLSALESDGISALVLKGFDLAHRVYPDPALRPMSDIDLLIQFKGLDRFLAIALDQGFQHAADRGTTEIRRRFDYELTVMKKDVAIDLHWDLNHRFSRRRWDLSGLFDRSSLVEYPSHVDRTPHARYRAMGWVDLLIYTAFHLDHHAFFALLGYPDNLIDQAGQKCRETMLAELKFVWVHDVARIVQTHPELLEDRQLWKELHRLDFEDGFACALRAALDLFPVGMSAIHLRIETAIHQADRIKPPSQRSTLPGWVYRRVPVLGIRGVRLLELRDYVLGGEHGGGSHGRRAVLSPRRWRQSALALGRIGAGYVQILRVWAWVKITNR